MQQFGRLVSEPFYGRGRLASKYFYEPAGVGLCKQGISSQYHQLEAQAPKSFLDPRRRASEKYGKVFREQHIMSSSQRLF